ncbi:response regulator [Kiritimatiellaeota bacterium B1221]|nr:response regulator [Kiritimatiellaeota bacterium B1221]
MKSSNKALMLGIIMGLATWVLDALISWHFFPGKSFLEMLYAYDPQRTLYVRSTVVMLFFIFGLIAGRLISTSEQTQINLHENLNLLNGMQKFHAEIVKRDDPNTLIEKVLPLLDKAFALESIGFFQLGGSPPLVTGEFGDAEIQDEQVRGKLIAKLQDFYKGQEIYSMEAKKGGEVLLAPVRMNDRLFGVLYARNADAIAFKEHNLQDHLQVVCNDLGHALAGLQDLQDLNASAEKLSSLYDNAPVGIYTTTLEGELLFANPTLAQLLGADTVEQLRSGQGSVARFYTKRSRRDDFIRLLKRDGFVVDFEAEVIGLKGEKRSLLYAARLLGSVDKGDLRIEGFAMDITKSKNAERENQILQQQLTESQHFKSITVLAGGVAHEFNNILQAMMGSAYLAQMKYPHGRDEVWRYLQDIQESGKRAAKLCDQMLSYAGKKAMLLKLEKADACLEDVLRILIMNAEAKVKIVKSLEAPQAQVRLDLPSFSEIVNQLVSNAEEAFSKESGGTITVSTEVREFSEADFAPYKMFRRIDPDDYWVLKIKDNGSGISPKDLPHIFEPFYTTKFQGRGLGLPSVAGLVEKFDGSLGVRTDSEQGSEFLLWIPVARAVVIEEPEENAVQVEEELEGSGKIWVVDDEPLICMTIQRLLTPLGFEVLTANDGEDAVEALSTRDPDEIRCLILDITMPRMGGLEALTQIREFMPDLKVLIMSGYDESDSLESFKDLKVDGFIHKPFRMEALQARLKDILS